MARGLQALGPPFRSIATIPQFGYVRRPAVFEYRRRRPLARIAPDAEVAYRRFWQINTQFPICPQIAHGSHPRVIKQAGLCAVDFLRRMFIGSYPSWTPNRATELVGTLSAEQAYSVGNAVGGLLKDGMPIERALSSTLTVAEFVTRGQAEQQAVDAILSAERSKRKA